MKYGIGSEYTDKQEAAKLVAVFLQGPVSEIEDIDVYSVKGKEIVEYAINGKYYKKSVKSLKKYQEAL